jgi:hypothetical protein
MFQQLVRFDGNGASEVLRVVELHPVSGVAKFADETPDFFEFGHGGHRRPRERFRKHKRRVTGTGDERQVTGGENENGGWSRKAAPRSWGDRGWKMEDGNRCSDCALRQNNFSIQPLSFSIGPGLGVCHEDSFALRRDRPQNQKSARPCAPQK